MIDLHHASWSSGRRRPGGSSGSRWLSLPALFAFPSERAIASGPTPDLLDVAPGPSGPPLVLGLPAVQIIGDPGMNHLASNLEFVLVGVSRIRHSIASGQR